MKSNRIGATCVYTMRTAGNRARSFVEILIQNATPSNVLYIAVDCSTIMIRCGLYGFSDSPCVTYFINPR